VTENCVLWVQIWQWWESGGAGSRIVSAATCLLTTVKFPRTTIVIQCEWNVLSSEEESAW